MGDATFLAGRSTPSRYDDGRGDAARFQHVTFCAFDTKPGAIAVLDGRSMIRAVEFW